MCCNHQLVELLENPLRRLPVIVISLDENETDPKTAIIDPDQLAQKVLGLAHVAILPGPQSFTLSDAVTKEFSVFRGAVRTYLPGFSFIEDRPQRHPLALPHRIGD